MKKFKALGLMLVTAMIWGFAFAAQRLGADYVSVYYFNGIRFLLGAVSLIPVMLIFEKKDVSQSVHNAKVKQTILAGILAGCVLFTASTLQQMGIEITKSAGKTSFMTGLYTVLVPIFAIFLGKKTSINIWIGAALAVVGMFFLCIVNENWQVVWKLGYGDIILFFNAVFWALHILVIDRFVDKIYSLRFALTQFLVCGIISMMIGFCCETIDFYSVRKALIAILYCGILSVGVAYTCQIIGQKMADPTYASIILSTESVFGAIGGAIILNERMTVPAYLGCFLIFAGVIISQIVVRPNKKPIKTAVSLMERSADDNR